MILHWQVGILQSRIFQWDSYHPHPQISSPKKHYVINSARCKESKPDAPRHIVTYNVWTTCFNQRSGSPVVPLPPKILCRCITSTSSSEKHSRRPDNLFQCSKMYRWNAVSYNNCNQWSSVVLLTTSTWMSVWTVLLWRVSGDIHGSHSKVLILIKSPSRNFKQMPRKKNLQSPDFKIITSQDTSLACFLLKSRSKLFITLTGEAMNWVLNGTSTDHPEWRQLINSLHIL